jgi:hypothetical protein
MREQGCSLAGHVVCRSGESGCMRGWLFCATRCRSHVVQICFASGGRITGDILLNGYPKVQATFARVMGYVEQTDIHSPQVRLVMQISVFCLFSLPGQPPACRGQLVTQTSDFSRFFLCGHPPVCLSVCLLVPWQCVRP